MPETPIHELPYPARTDRADVQLDLQELAVRLDEVIGAGGGGDFWTKSESDARFAPISHNHDASYWLRTDTVIQAGIASIGTHPVHGATFAGLWKGDGAAGQYGVMTDGTSLYLNAETGNIYFRKGNADMMTMRSDAKFIVGPGAFVPGDSWACIHHGRIDTNYDGAWGNNVILSGAAYSGIGFHASGHSVVRFIYGPPGIFYIDGIGIWADPVVRIPGGVATKFKVSGAPTDADFTSPQDGLLCIAPSSYSGYGLWARVNGYWQEIGHGTA